MSVNWGPTELQENQSVEQASQEQDSAVMPITPTEPVAPRYPTNHIAPATFSNNSTNDQNAGETQTQHTVRESVDGQNIHSTNLWRLFQEEAKQGESR